MYLEKIMCSFPIIWSISSNTTQNKNSIKMVPLELSLTPQKSQGYESRNKAALDGFKIFL